MLTTSPSFRVIDSYLEFVWHDNFWAVVLPLLWFVSSLSFLLFLPKMEWLMWVYQAIGNKGANFHCLQIIVSLSIHWLNVVRDWKSPIRFLFFSVAKYFLMFIQIIIFLKSFPNSFFTPSGILTWNPHENFHFIQFSLQTVFFLLAAILTLSLWFKSSFFLRSLWNKFHSKNCNIHLVAAWWGFDWEIFCGSTLENRKTNTRQRSKKEMWNSNRANLSQYLHGENMWKCNDCCLLLLLLGKLLVHAMRFS